MPRKCNAARRSASVWVPPRQLWKPSALAMGLVCLMPVLGQMSFAGIVFTNANAIVIPSRGVANTYPASIDVSGISGRLQNIQISLYGVTHSYPNDLAAVVVSPSNRAALLFSGPGGNVRASNLDWVFDDKAVSPLPLDGQLSSGSFQPGEEQYDDFFPAPGPGGKLVDADPAPWAFDFSPWLSESPNGRWNLYVIDAQAGDAGSISGGWGIEFEVSAVPEPSALGGACLLLIPLFSRRRRC